MHQMLNILESLLIKLLFLDIFQYFFKFKLGFFYQQNLWKELSIHFCHVYRHSMIKEPETACFSWVRLGVLKLVCLLFSSNFYFSPNDSPSETMKNAFYFIWKALFVLEIFKFLYFCSSLFFYLSVIALEDD